MPADSTTSEVFHRECARCPRLLAFRRQTQSQHANYYAGAVPSFGVEQPRLLVVGLAPGKHGAHRSGRPFTGDASGRVLFEALFHSGLSSQRQSLGVDDGIRLAETRITNAVRCLPPDNRPTASEIANCAIYLEQELQALVGGGVVLALGKIAFDAVCRVLTGRQPVSARGDPPSAGNTRIQQGKGRIRFKHGGLWELAHRGCSFKLIASYHPSRLNVNTGRLTQEMFNELVAFCVRHLTNTSTRAQA